MALTLVCACLIFPVVTCSNVLLSDDQRACLADLGFAQVLGSAARTAKGGSRLYAAPELLMGARCTLAADVYSFGVLLIELTTQQVVRHRGDWRLPQAPQQCPQVSVYQAAVGVAPRQGTGGLPFCEQHRTMLGCITPARCFNSFFAPKFLQEVVDLIQECMSSDPQRRPSAAQALRRLQQDAGDAAAA